MRWILAFLGIVLCIIAIIVCISIIWRFFSCRYQIPCPVWLAWLVERDNPFTKINRATTIIEHLDLQPGMVVLDAGCGPGRLSIPIAHKVGPKGEVVAMDIQSGMLRKVKERAEAEKLKNITLLQAGIGEKRLEHSKFDRALLVTVLGEIPNQNREAALKEIFDTLKPGGMLSVTEIIFDPHFQRRNTVLRLARAVGFQEKNIFGSWYAFTLNLMKPL